MMSTTESMELVRDEELELGVRSQIENPNVGFSASEEELSKKMAKLNLAFVKKCAESIDKSQGDPSCSLIPIAKDYISYTCQIIQTFQDEHPSSGQILTSFQKDIESTVTKLSREIKPSLNPTRASRIGIGNVQTYSSRGINSFSRIAAQSIPARVFGNLPQSTGLVRGEDAWALDCDENLSVTPLPSSELQISGSCFESKPFQSSMFPTSSGIGSDSDRPTESESHDDTDETYVLPVITFTSADEPGSVFQTRIKLFEKSGDEFKDRGLATLFVKKLENGRHQLLLRAANNLGLILLNMLLADKIPLSTKKNHVATIDPNGNDGKGTMFLFRVKTEADAEALKITLGNFQAKS